MRLAAGSNVIVVGGGIVGASIAWHLAQETNVTIVAEKIGGDATPNSFAWINAAYNNPKFYYDFRYRSMQRWAEIGDQLPDLPLTWSGSLNWNMEPEKLQDYLHEHSAWGYDIVGVNRTEIKGREPELTDDIIPGWGLYAGQEGFLEAHVAAAQLISHAEALGAVVLESSVTRFLKGDDGSVGGVETSSGDVIQGSHIVLAAGLGSVPLLDAEGIRLPLNGRDGLLVNSKPTGKRWLNTLVNAESLHMRQTFDGIIRCGAEFSGSDVGDDPQETAYKLFAKLQSAFTNGHELEYGHYTIGTRPDPEDGYPILGNTGLGGVTVAVMHSGVTNAAIVGELLTKQILTGESDPALTHFRLDRFKDSTASASSELK